MDLLTLLVTFCLAVMTLGQQTSTGKPCGRLLAGPLTTAELAETFSPLANPEPQISEAIRSTLAFSAWVYDGQHGDLLDNIFTDDAVINSTVPSFVISGLGAMKMDFEKYLDPSVSTHYQFGNVYVYTCVQNPNYASSIIYFTSTSYKSATNETLGTVEWDNADVIEHHGRHEDYWEKQDSGVWKISHRNQVRMVSVHLTHCQSILC